MRLLFALSVPMLLGITGAAPAADEDRTLKIVVTKTLPTIESISVYASKDIKPGKQRPKPLSTVKFSGGAGIRLGGGVYHIYVKPKNGIGVLVAEKLSIKAGQTQELKLGDLLGVVEVFQKEGFPRVDRIVLTAPDDPGPDAKEHRPVQIGADYRVEMAVAEGFYAVWLVPANGARAQRIEDRIRVLPGKIVRLGN
jgi:hypothetical protein